MLPLGTILPPFSLNDTVTGQVINSQSFRGLPGVVICFICNHCPFVKHIADELADVGRHARDKGLAFIAISSNDITTHPDDAPEKMAEFAEQHAFTFPYCYDETQDVAKAFKAACTPDFYVFDDQMQLAYRGQFDDSRPDAEAPVTGADLRAAIDAVAEGNQPTKDQKPSIGCNIKWKKGAEPDYFG
jgi:peroxiredoxin